MVERLIQTIKRRLAVFDVDPNWSSVTLANRVANIIESIRLIPNSTTKITRFEAHFGRKPNTEISNITTKPSIHKNLTNKCLEKRILSQNTLTMEEIWRRDGNSEDELDIRYKNSGDEKLNSDSDNSEDIPLAKNQRNFTSTRKTHHLKNT